MTDCSGMKVGVECWTDVSHSGEGALPLFYTVIGVMSLLIGLVVLGLLIDAIANGALDNFWTFGLISLSGLVFVCSGIIHLFMAYNFRSRVRVLEDLGEGCFRLTLWKDKKNRDVISFPRNEIEEFHQCNKPESIFDFLRSLPRESSCYCFHLSTGYVFYIAGDEASVQKALRMLGCHE